MKASYPRADIDGEIRKMDAWLLSNPAKRKKNYERFISSWLKRVNDTLPPSNPQFSFPK
jgi:hypothetical protein